MLVNVLFYFELCSNILPDPCLSVGDQAGISEKIIICQFSMFINLELRSSFPDCDIRGKWPLCEADHFWLLFLSPLLSVCSRINFVYSNVSSRHYKELLMTALIW